MIILRSIPFLAAAVCVLYHALMIFMIRVCTFGIITDQVYRCSLMFLFDIDMVWSSIRLAINASPTRWSQYTLLKQFHFFYLQSHS